MSNKGFVEDCDVEFTSKVMDSMILNKVVNGADIAQLLGNYGLFRELFSTGSLSVNCVSYKIGDVLVRIDNEVYIYPVFLIIEAIYVTDCRDCFFVCEKLHTVTESHHFQAFEIVQSGERVALNTCHIKSLVSPWPLKIRKVQYYKFISLRHEI